MQGQNAHPFIPQDYPMVLVDRILESSSTLTVCVFRVKEDGLFMSDGSLSESGLAENMAQTAAAGVGFRYKTENKEVPVGFIASIRNLKIHELPLVGSELYTETMMTDSVMDVSFVQGTIRLGSKVIAECEMRIFLNPSI